MLLDCLIAQTCTMSLYCEPTKRNRESGLMTKGAFHLQDNSNERRLLSACLGKWQNDCSNETTCHYDERGINKSSHFWQMSYLKCFLFSNMTVHSFWRSPNLINTKGSKSKKLSIVSKIPQALPIRTQKPQNVAFSSRGRLFWHQSKLS